ncbi:hypothetical protein NDN08_000445 [Rhodosorus marinus]|uniref:20 kDa chaperonin, chloroplastic n=1 Tax=Rhodosorus marinus TaxID=101924 RepID=A0AAV8UN70_9RHOD|nr:hypothetical protein NDN08_000445 [Rhodosorus marinus]
MAGFVSSVGWSRSLRGDAVDKSVTVPHTSRKAVVRMASDEHELQGRKITGTPVPIRNYVFAKRAAAPDSTEGGLVLADVAKEKPNFGTVLATGDGGSYRLTGIKMPMVVKPGDSVVFGRFGGLEVTYDNSKHIFVDQFDLLCKLKEGDYKPENVEPLFDKVFVKVAKKMDQTASGIMIAPGASESKNMGEVMSTGPGRALENGEYEEMPVSSGQSVLWGDYVGTKLAFDRDNEYVFLRASDLLAAW